jgi:hypothetical protein
MSDHRPRILISGRCDKIVRELQQDESLNEFILEYIPDVKHVVGMIPQIGAAYALIFLSSDSDDTDQLLAGMTPFTQSRRSFLMLSLSVDSKEDISQLLLNPSILTLMPKPISAANLGNTFRVFGIGGPWNRLLE